MENNREKSISAQKYEMTDYYPVFTYANQCLIRVTQQEVEKLQLSSEISGFSFADLNFVYLDTEVDLPKFLHRKYGLPFLSADYTADHYHLRRRFFTHCHHPTEDQLPHSLRNYSPVTLCQL